MPFILNKAIFETLIQMRALLHKSKPVRLLRAILNVARGGQCLNSLLVYVWTIRHVLQWQFAHLLSQKTAGINSQSPGTLNWTKSRTWMDACMWKIFILP